MSNNKLSEAEERAIEWLREEGGCMLISRISEKNDRDVFGRIEPGMSIFKKLEKKGLVYFTEEDEFEIEPGVMFSFTPEVYLVTPNDSAK